MRVRGFVCGTIRRSSASARRARRMQFCRGSRRGFRRWSCRARICRCQIRLRSCRMQAGWIWRRPAISESCRPVPAFPCLRRHAAVWPTGLFRWSFQRMCCWGGFIGPSPGSVWRMPELSPRGSGWSVFRYLRGWSACVLSDR